MKKALLLPFCLILFSFQLYANSPTASETKNKAETNLLREFNNTMFGLLFFDVSQGKVKVKEFQRPITGKASILEIDNDHYTVKTNKQSLTVPKSAIHPKNAKLGELVNIFYAAPVLDATSTEQKTKTVSIKFLILLLLGGAIFFTVFYRFINIRLFKHAIDVIRGKYDDPEDDGDITHFQALTSALSATVGLGNIAGVAIAIYSGGPGAVFWMMCVAIFGMTAKFSSCTLAQLYRQHNEDGSISGGPMYYLDLGLSSIGLKPLGKILAFLFAFMIMGAALGGGNMFQSNQTFAIVKYSFFPESNGSSTAYIFGFTMAFFVGLVIIGGIKRIGSATSKIVPSMCAIYIITSLIVIFSNSSLILPSISLIFEQAFSSEAFAGGMIGVMMVGIQRAAFSNEAGLGSASIAHAAAKTKEPVREGLVAMVGPIIDTVVVCSMTAMVVIITGKWNDTGIIDSAKASGDNAGVVMTAKAFESVIPWFPYVLAICIVLFAFSTMISWCYYGERGWVYIVDHFKKGFGFKSLIIYRLLFVGAVVVGAVHDLKDVLDFSDVMILSLAFPNIIGSIILAPKIWHHVKDYWQRYNAGEIKPYK